jgi:superfamily II DNA/RNA helicase
MQNYRTSNRRSRGQSNFRSRAGHSSFDQRNGRKGAPALDIQAFINQATKAAAEPQVAEKVTHTFADFALCDALKRNLNYRKYLVPTPIQDQAIGPILECKDLIGMANTGTGKTAAFLLPMIEKVYCNRSERVLIIAPTRELAQQIEAELRQFAAGMKISHVSCVGGMPIYRQIRELKNYNPNFVIGTPGRLKDLADRGLIRFNSFNNVVLDEVDRMLDMGFINEIRWFLSQLPSGRQSLFFSATMPPKIKALIETFSNNPVVVQVKSQEISANIAQEVIKSTKDTKFNQLKEILGEEGAKSVLVYNRDTQNLFLSL